jgi:predicted neuraminidase
VLVTGQLEVSYPCFAKHPDGRLMLAYTDERKSIAVMKVET